MFEVGKTYIDHALKIEIVCEKINPESNLIYFSGKFPKGYTSDKDGFYRFMFDEKCAQLNIGVIMQKI